MLVVGSHGVCHPRVHHSPAGLPASTCGLSLGVSHLRCPGSLLKHVLSDVPSQDSVWLSLEQPGQVSPGTPAAHLKASGLFLL